MHLASGPGRTFRDGVFSTTAPRVPFANGAPLEAYADGALGAVNGGHLTAFRDGVLSTSSPRHPFPGVHDQSFSDGVLGYVPGAQGYPQPMFGEGRAFADGVFSHGGSHAAFESHRRSFADGVLGAIVNGKYNQSAYRGGVMRTPYAMMAGRDGALGQQALIDMTDAERNAALKGLLFGLVGGAVLGVFLGATLEHRLGRKK